LLFFLSARAQGWQANWISAIETKKDTNVWQAFRKTITLKEKPKIAYARIAVDSKYWLWINGKLAVYEGGLKRGPNPDDTYFDQVDISKYVHEGKNTFAFLTWYWGKDGFSHKSSGKAGFIAEMHFDGEGVGTDHSWKAKRHPAYGNTQAPYPNLRLSEGNIHFDARNDIGQWIMPGYNDAGWSDASEFGRPPVAPWNKLVKRPIPLWKVEELKKYENDSQLPKVSDGTPVIAKLPRNISVSPYLKIKAPAGLTIDMRTDDYNGGSEYNFRSEYVTKEGVQEFENLAYLNGHSMIYTIPAGVEILGLRYRETRYNTEFNGHFACNDTLLNKLWAKCVTTLNLNMRDNFMDCPDRERAQWWGDVVILEGEVLHSCDQKAFPLIKKAIENLVDWQKPDGVLYSPVPSGKWDRELSGQMLSSIGEYGFWYYYQYTGDLLTIRHAYPAVKRYLQLWKLGEDGLLIHRAGGWDWGDWGENIDRPVLDNALLYQALNAAVKMAKVTGNNADTSTYQKMAKSIKDNYNRVFWSGKEYRSPGYTGITDDRGHGLAVLFGLAETEQYPAIKKVLEHSFNASPYMEKYILESLFKMGDATGALNRMKARYKKMVESPLTTLWEGWGIGAEGYGGGSYNHGWSGGPLTLMAEYVCGIQPVESGFSRFQVMPQPGYLDHAATSFETVNGTVKTSFLKSAQAMTIKVTVPAGTNANVGVPKDKIRQILLNGKVVWEKGRCIGPIKQGAAMPSNRIGFEVSSGDWVFRAIYDK